MVVKMKRYNSEADYTDGMFFIDGKYECFSIEDEGRTEKVYGETRIPDGEYEISLRTEGSFHERYLKKFGPEFHLGMLAVHNAPDWKIIMGNITFQYVLVHIGNDDDDTAGCLLTGSVAYAYQNKVDASTTAYKKLYPKIAKHLHGGGTVKLIVETIEKEGLGNA